MTPNPSVWKPHQGLNATAQAGSGDARPKVRVSVAELALMLDKHMRFLKGRSHGQRLDLSMQCLAGLSFAGRNLDHSELRGADLTGCDLTNASLVGANLFCADLSGATLVSCNLEKADLRGARFDNANLDRANFDGADCREGALIRHDPAGFGTVVGPPRPRAAASFERSTIARSSFRDANLAGASFRQAAIAETRFEKANLDNAAFNDASVVRADFTAAAIGNADFSDAKLVGNKADQPFQSKRKPPTAAFDERLRRALDWHQEWVATLSRRGARLVLKDAVLQGLLLEGADLSAADFRNVDMRDAHLKSARLAMAAFIGCKLNNSDLRDVDARGARFTGSDLSGSDLTGGNFSAITQAHSKIARWKSDFSDANLSRTILDSGTLTDCRFLRTNMAEAMAVHAKLNRSDFTGATLAQADFRGSNLESAVFASANAKGAKGLAGRV